MVKRVKQDLVGLAFAGALLAAPAMSGAAILAGNPLGTPSGADNSFSVPGTLLAENFTLGGSFTLQTLVFTGYNRVAPTPGPLPETIYWSIRMDDGSGRPESSAIADDLTSSFTASVTPVATDPDPIDPTVTGYEVREYFIDVSGSGIDLIAGDYWVTFHANIPAIFGCSAATANDDPNPCDFGWANAESGDGFAARSDDDGANWPGHPVDLAFSIEGTAVPVPATLSLLGLGLALLGARRRTPTT